MLLWIIELVEQNLAKGKMIIQKLIKGEKVDIDQSGLSKREWNELMVALDLKDKLI